MAQPTADTKLGAGDIHTKLHNEHVNVKSFGAVGDGVTDDTAEIQAAVDAAASVGNGQVVFPPGIYRITNTLTLNSSAVRLSGAMESNPDQADTGVKIVGNLSGALIQRTDSVSTRPFIIEDLSVHNEHNTGTCISLVGVESPGGVYRCYIRGNKGLVLGANTFQTAVEHCRFSRIGTYAGSLGINTTGHGFIANTDFAGFEQGILAAGPATVILGGRIETCGTGIYLGSGGNLFKGTVESINFEACDTCVNIHEAGPAVLSGLQMLGTGGSPSGGSIIGIDVDNTFGVTIIGCSGGTFSNATFRVPSAAQRHQLTFIGCGGTWNISESQDLQIINCDGFTNLIRAGVYAAGSLLAGNADNDGYLIIEDNGAGDRNLILYAGGQRFRIDGGAAI